MVEPIFTKARVDAMRPHIQTTVDDLLDTMLKRGGEEPVDLVGNFALPVPSYVRDFSHPARRGVMLSPL